MSVLDSIKRLVSDDTESATSQTYRCPECGHEFKTAKNHEERISCPECMNNDVEPASTA